MKKIKFFAFFLGIAFFSSCIDIEEKIIINDDNSGTYSVTIDMNKMLEMITQMKLENVSEKETTDSVITLREIVDTAQVLSSNEKELFKEASFTLKIDEENNQMKVIAVCPFKNISNLSFIKNNLFGVIKKLNLFEKESNKNEPISQAHSKENNPSNPLAPFYTFTVTPGKISYLINDKEGLDRLLMGSEDLIEIKKMAPAMKDFSYRTIIALPGKIKKAIGPSNIVSADKKTITFTRNFTDFVKRPKNLEYIIEY